MSSTVTTIISFMMSSPVAENRELKIYEIRHENGIDSEIQIQYNSEDGLNQKTSVAGRGEDHKEDQKSSVLVFQAALFVIILEGTLKQIKILAECNNELRVTKALSDMPLLLTYKYQVVQPGTEECGAGDSGRLNSDKYKLNKLEADRKYFKDVIMVTLSNLKSSQNFDTLTEEIHRIEGGHQDFIKIVEEEAKNKQLRRELYKQLRHQRNHFKTVIYDANTAIEDLKSNVEEYCLNAETQIRYIENWQRARSEQNDQSIHNTESLPSGIIEYYKQRLDQEQRVHSEIELLFNILIDEASDKVEDWMNKYDKDMENIDLKIQFKKNDYQDTRDRRLDLENTLEKHDTLMKEWTHFKEKREKARLYTEKMTKSAIIVQAWWRGLLVRRGLGPYRVSKKKARQDKKK